MSFPPSGESIISDSPSAPGRRRGGVLFPTLVILAILVIAFSSFAGFYSDILWFRSVNFSSVFTTQLITRVGLFFIFGLVLAFVVLLNAWIAYRIRPVFRGLSLEQQNLDRYRVALEPFRGAILIAAAAGLLLIGGSSAATQWGTYLLWGNGVDFGTTDPQFGRDISFFTFDLPWYRFLLGFGFAVLILSILLSLVVHYIYGGIRLQTPGERFTPAATAHISVLLGIFMLLKAVAYWFDRFQLAVTPNSLFTGLNFAQVNAVLPAKNILMFIAVITAGLFIFNVFRRTWALPLAALGLLVFSAIVIGSLYPAFVQRFQVNPSQATKEQPFIQRNIDATLSAYDLKGIEKQDYQAKEKTTAKAIAADRSTINNARLLDPSIVPPTFNQLQQIRGYYSFADTLDVDRYTVNGKQRDAVVALREINLAGIPESNWINNTTVFTHGFGFTGAYSNTANADGAPAFFESNIPPKGALDIKQPRVYFGENSPIYSIVGAPAGSVPQELDYPDDASANGQRNNTYSGTGGVPVGSLFNKLVFAVKYQEGNILLSNLVNSESKILYDRNPRDRVQKVAPWLTLDGDPYPSVVNGRIVWIVDAYTTTNGYPYSTRTQLGEAIADSITADSQFVQAQVGTDVNYIRNSVKATVDAYDGTVSLYEWDTKDPILKSWSAAFPGSIKPRSEIEDALLQHVRYPEDLFKVQRELYSRYHVQDALAFYSGQDFWAIPNDPTKISAGQPQPPYYLTLKMPGTNKSAFSLTTTFSPNNRQTLAAFMAVNAEPGPNYGKIRVLELPRNTTIPGPVQVQNNIESDPLISSQLSLLRRGGSEVEVGNLLTLPVGGGLLYVEPIYVRAAQTDSFPLLRKVAVSFGSRTAMADTLDQALRSIFVGDTGNSNSNETDSGTVVRPPSTVTTLDQALDAATKAYEDSQTALRRGDLTAFAEAQKRLGEALDKVAAARGTTTSGSRIPSFARLSVSRE
jgi:uncharacterized membrane protein (UPF0182 family)